MPQLAAFGKALPAGYRMQIGGDAGFKQQAGFANLVRVLIISIIGIYAAFALLAVRQRGETVLGSLRPRYALPE